MLAKPDLIIREQFVGPPDLGNGGYVVGAMAETLAAGDVIGAGAFEVTLRGPLPVNKTLTYAHSADDSLGLYGDDDLLALAKRAELSLDVPKAADVDLVRAAMPSSLSLKRGHHQTLGDRIGVHPICFCCGAERDEGDGLRVFPTVAGEGTDVTALWTPHSSFACPDGTIGPDIIAAAIDCPGAFAFLAEEKPAGLLGRMTVEYLKPLKAKEEALILGWQLAEEGRKMFAGTAIFDASGDLVAKAKQVWFGFPG